MDDLIQETYLKLCADEYRLLRAYDPKHPDAIYGYLKVITANVVHDRFKALHSEKRGGDQIVEDLTTLENRSGAERGVLEVSMQWSAKSCCERSTLI